MIRHIVKLGHYQEFMAAMAAWNDAARSVGLPPYRIWESQFGSVQEVFTEAEFESIDAHLAALEAAHTDASFAAANQELSSHLVDGSLHDYVLFEAGRPEGSPD
jgi:NIPSNAP.